MMGLLTRLLRIFWRQDAEIGASMGFVPGFAAATPVLVAEPSPVVVVDFSRHGTDSKKFAQASDLPRLLAVRLRSVEQTNAPKSRVRTKTTSAPPAGKPIRKASAPALKPARKVKPGHVLERIRDMTPPPSAQIVHLNQVRQARACEAVDREIAALFG